MSTYIIYVYLYDASSFTQLITFYCMYMIIMSITYTSELSMIPATQQEPVEDLETQLPDTIESFRVLLEQVSDSDSFFTDTIY